MSILVDMSNFNSLSIIGEQKPKFISIRDLVVDSIETYKIDAPKVRPTIEFSEDAIQCYNIPHLQFSNCLPCSLNEGSLPSHVKTAFDNINKDHNIIGQNIKHINHIGKNKDRIEEILKKYLDTDFNKYINCYYKSDIHTGILLKDRGCFRVISLYIVEPKIHKKQKHSKHKLIVLFFDPFHLFIPSNDYGTTVYNKICNYSLEQCNLIHIKKHP